MPGRAIVAQELAEIFGVLAHPDRIRIIEELRAGEKDVHTLQEDLGAEQPRVSRHLALLRARRMVQVRREGRHVYYRLTQSELAGWIVEGLSFLEGLRGESERSRKAVAQARRLWSEKPSAAKRKRLDHGAPS